MNTTILRDIDSDKLWLGGNPLPTSTTKSKHTWLIIRLQYCDYWSEEWGNEIRAAHGHGKAMASECPKCKDDDGEPTWCSVEPMHIELLAANPGIQSKKHIADIERSMGVKWAELNLEAKLQVLLDHGTFALLWQKSGIDEEALVKAAHEQLAGASVMGGAMLDRQQNAIGSTGWDLLKGDFNAGLKRADAKSAYSCTPRGCKWH